MRKIFKNIADKLKNSCMFAVQSYYKKVKCGKI